MNASFEPHQAYSLASVVEYVSKKAINELMARQSSPEDLLVFGPNEERNQLLEPTLNAGGVSSAIAKVTFAPGPADVPALRFFNDLQIEPIWQEALDDRFLDNVEAAYDKFVERGGAPAVNHIRDFLSGVFNANVFLNELLDTCACFKDHNPRRSLKPSRCLIRDERLGNSTNPIYRHGLNRRTSSLISMLDAHINRPWMDLETATFLARSRS